jgi:hypothetical protein
MRRALAVTRKGHAHLLAQKQWGERSSTEIPMTGGIPFPKAPKNPAREQNRFGKKFSA